MTLRPLISCLLPVLLTPAPAQQPAAPAAPPPPAAAKPGALDVTRHQRLAEAAVIGLKWQDHVKQGTLEKGTSLWGYQAFEQVGREQMLAKFTNPPPGKLTYSALLEDRCSIDMDGARTGQPGIYITLRLFSEYATGARRETLTLHEPAKGGTGLKIIALRRQPVPGGQQGMFDLAADIGQLCLLKLNAAPKDRWEPLAREAKALAAALNLTLPEIPEATKENEATFGGQLVKLILEETPALLAKVPRPADAPPSFDSALPAARAILHAYALMLLYTPGDETAGQLAVLATAEAEKAKLPRSLLKPLIERVHNKGTLPEVHETVLTMASDVSRLLEDAENAFGVARAPSEVLTAAFKNMSRLPSYHASARFNAAGDRTSTMDAVLAPGAIDLTLTGFDGVQQLRNASKDGFFLSTDGGQTWTREATQETTEGLCRTLQTPVDPANGVIKSNIFQFSGIEEVEGEALYRFTSQTDNEKVPARDYWVLLSAKGPTIRQARLPMKFGDLETAALFRYTKLGKEVERVSPTGKLVVPVPEKGK